MSLSRLCATVLLCLTLLATPCLAWELPEPGRLSPAEATEVVQNLQDDLVILDVRTPGEFAEGHAEGALLIPLEELASRADDIPEEKPVLILCRSGRRAAAAFDILARAGRNMEEVWYLEGYTDYKAGEPHFHR
ncbi:rhodanese-like domain-containing protein [Mailhella massiliensis]|uniref:Rhodanese-like domain-containing protein n=1 Tax=Mailhella massiliensis TaxID=1903261 RepID=A0A921DQT1_9BACT|nr:rhodanese-like domain-containing protein [Mailhella massiliensis]HJD96261.1 rhodanese-like domain-containing protein [Mailhella massiliensis]